jgi:uncharacterized membrane protein
MAPQQHPSKETLQKWHHDPANWKWGFIYFNKEDPRLFPPKRVEMLGWTVNFANPRSIVAMVGLVAVVLLSAKFLKTM